MGITQPAPPPVAQGRAVAGGTTYLSLPGVDPNPTLGTFVISSGIAFYLPIWTPTDISIDQYIIEVTTGAASTCRMGIYTADKNWQPATLVAGSDSGSVSTTAIAVVTTSVTPFILPAGRALIWFNQFSAAPTLRSMRAQAPYGYNTGLGSGTTTLTTSKETQNNGTNAAPSTPLAWTQSNNSTPSLFEYFVWLRVSTP
jgi:hypothetical protein